MLTNTILCVSKCLLLLHESKKCCNFAGGISVNLIINCIISYSCNQYVTSALLAKEIQADEIKVKTSGADFVFDKDYQLRPLSEVKAFIQENQHLPEIKSAQEMQEDGVSVSELQTQLLQKIEELTLYILQQEERIKALENK